MGQFTARLKRHAKLVWGAVGVVSTVLGLVLALISADFRRLALALWHGIVTLYLYPVTLGFVILFGSATGGLPWLAFYLISRRSVKRRQALIPLPVEVAPRIDEFENAELEKMCWLWKPAVSHRGFEAQGLAPLCPLCLTRLDFGGRPVDVKGFRARCPREGCGFDHSRPDVSYRELISKVQLELTRLYDSKEWPDAVRKWREREQKRRIAN